MTQTTIDFSGQTPEDLDSPEGAKDTEAGYFDTFKDTSGRFRTQSLFVEHTNDSYPTFFTLKKRDNKGKMSLYRKYMEIGDPTEYQVAIQLFGSWDHWQALMRAKWFMVHLIGWRKELKNRMESERYHDMLVRSAQAGPQGIQATKWLAERYGGTAKQQNKRGRPSKEEKAAHLVQSTREAEDTASDLKRLGID